MVGELTLFFADLSVYTVEINSDRSISELGCASPLKMYNHAIQYAGYTLSYLEVAPKIWNRSYGRFQKNHF